MRQGIATALASPYPHQAQSVLIRGARQLLTLRGPGPRRGAELGELAIIEDGAVLICGGVIREVGPTRRVENLAEARSAREWNAAGRVVMPGFVDADTQLAFGPAHLGSLDRRHPAAHPPNGDPAAYARQIRTATPRGLEFRAGRYLAGMVRHGTVAAGVRTGFTAGSSDELKLLKVLAGLNRNPIDLRVATSAPACYPHGTTPMEYVNWWQSELLPAVHRRRLAGTVALTIPWNGAHPLEARRILAAARELGYPVQVRGHGDNWDAAGLALEFEAATLADFDCPADALIPPLARAATIAVLAPARDMLGRAECPPVQEWIERGVAIALSTGFNPLDCPSYSMGFAVSAACRWLGLTAAEAIAAATVNAACAIGLGHRMGALEPGKRANLMILNASDYRELPYLVGVNLVSRVFRDGQPIFIEADSGEPVA